jgi:murein DD-endopeptidase MepM/ murein hydrolase activator NlpD
MRRFFPLLVIALTFLVYEGRRVLLTPFLPDRAAVSKAASDEAGPGIETEASVETAAGGVPAVKTGKISRGTSFFEEMQRAGVSPAEIQGVVAASKNLFDFRRVRSGQKYVIYPDAAGGIDSLEFVEGTESILRVRKEDDGFVARADTVPYRVEHYLTQGTITSSIYDALQEQDANAELASYLAVIFQWDIDFFKDIRRGDTFTILYENRVYENGRTALGHVLAARVRTQGEEHYAFAFRSEDGVRNYYNEEGRSLQKSLLRAPLRYSRISSNFTYRRLHPVTHTYRPHLGVDYVAPVGSPVHSTGDGMVLVATRDRANGNFVKIRHNSRYTTYYLHLRGFAKGIRSGARVRQGQVIGYLGGTGLATAPHLDYRIKVDGRFVNPRTIRLPSKEPVPASEAALFEVTKNSYLLEFSSADASGGTVLVSRPTPPLQRRLASVLF